MSESIYGLIPPPVDEVVRPPMHRSKYPHDTPPSASTFGASAAGQTLTSNLSGSYFPSGGVHRHMSSSSTLGPKYPSYPDPTTFLKKDTKPDLPQPSRFVYTDSSKPRVPPHSHSHSQLSSVGQSVVDNTTPSSSSSSSSLSSSPSTSIRASASASKRNFITENALAVIMAESRVPVSDAVNYLHRSDYGRVPRYLALVKQDLDREKEYIRAVINRDKQEKMKNQPTLTVLPEDERQKLVVLLKSRWETVNREYQGMTHLIVLDTHGKQRRKDEYEAHLQFLEKSIEKLSKTRVYIKEEGPH